MLVVCSGEDGGLRQRDFPAVLKSKFSGVSRKIFRSQLIKIISLRSEISLLKQISREDSGHRP
jgi:hypothetical protein